MHTFVNGEFEKHTAEVKEKWGKTDAYKEYAERTADYTGQKYSDLAAGMDSVLAEFAACMKKGEAPASPAAQELVKKLQNYITQNYYRCTKEILAGLGQMYAADERFRVNIDSHAAGTAAYIGEAITVYCRN